MKRKLQRALCCAMAAMLLLLAACGNQGNTNPNEGSGTQGRYVETDITPEGADIMAAFKTAEGKLVAFSQGLQERYDSDDGTNWQKSDGPGKANPELAKVSVLTMGADGTLMGTVNGDETGTASDRIVKIRQDGTTEDVKLPDYDEALATGKPVRVSTLQLLAGGRLLLSYSYGGAMASFGTGGEEEDTPEGEEPQEGETAQNESNKVVTMDEDYFARTALYNTETGQIVKDLTEEAGFTQTADEENLYLMGYDGAINKRSLADGGSAGKLEEKKQGQPENGAQGNDIDNLSHLDFSQQLQPDGAGGVYLLGRRQLEHLTAAGEKTAITPATAFAFGGTNQYLMGYLQLGDERFVVHLLQDNAGKLYRYDYDANVKIDPAKTLNIWALRDSATVRAAMAEFMKKHPDATLNFEVALEGGEAQNAADAIRNLNTRVLAGDGPDVIILDDTPAESYAEKGMLLDVTGKLNTDSLYEPVKTQMLKDGKLYYVPARFGMPLLFGSEENMQGLDTLQKLAEAAASGKDKPATSADGSDGFSELPRAERPLLSPETLDEVYKTLWNASAADIVQDGKINAENLRGFLQALKQIADKYKLNGSGEEGGGMAVMATVNSGGSTSIITGAAIAYASGRAQLGMYTLEDLGNTSILSDGSTQYKALPGLTKGAWLPSAMAGVNASTKVEELAVEFVQTMLGTEVQKASTGGFPVTAEGASAQIEALNTMMKESGGNTGFSFNMDALVSQMQTPVVNDDVLHGIILEAVKGYVNGASLEETVKTIEQQTQNYLAERAQ